MCAPKKKVNIKKKYVSSPKARTKKKKERKKKKKKRKTVKTFWIAKSQPFPGGVAVPENENASGALCKGEKKKTIEMSKRRQNKGKKKRKLFNTIANKLVFLGIASYMHTYSFLLEPLHGRNKQN